MGESERGRGWERGRAIGDEGFSTSCRPNAEPNDRNRALI